MSALSVPSVLLNTGASIPQLGFGTYKVDPAHAQSVVETALEVGFRHLDTAQMYRNEAQVGHALRATGVDREEVFLTTKLDNPNHAPEAVKRSFDASLRDLQVDYVDLFLIHWPLPMFNNGDITPTWRAMESLYEDGRARAVGVSNFLPHHLQPILRAGGLIPAVNQVESHPYLPMTQLHELNAQHGIVTEAWSPLARGQLVTDPVLAQIGAAHGKSAAQVALRWAIQRGDIVFPKSLRRERMIENAQIFDFELSDREVALIARLDRGEDGRCGSHPNTLDRM